MWLTLFLLVWKEGGDCGTSQYYLMCHIITHAHINIQEINLRRAVVGWMVGKVFYKTFPDILGQT